MKTILMNPLNKFARHYLLFFSVMITFTSQISAAGWINSVSAYYDSGFDRITVSVVVQATQDNCAFGNTHALYPDIMLGYRFYGTNVAWQNGGTASGSTGAETNNATRTHTFYVNNPVRGTTYEFTVWGWTVWVYPCNQPGLSGKSGQAIPSSGTQFAYNTPFASIPLNWQFSNLTVSPTNGNTLSWNKPSDETNMNEALDDYSYTIERRKRKWGQTTWDSWVTIGTAGKSANTYNDPPSPDLKSCYEYEYRLSQSMSKAGYTWHNIKQATAQTNLGSLIVPTPQNFTIVNEAGLQCQATAGSRELQWDVPITEINPCTEIWFRIKRQRVDANGSVIPGSDSTIVDSAAGKTYGGSKFAANLNVVTLVSDNNGNRKFSFIDNLNLKLGQRYKYSLTAGTRIKVEGVYIGTPLYGTTIRTATANIPGLITTSTQTIQKQIIDKTVKFTWTDNIPNESKFYIYRKQKNTTNEYQKIGEVNATTTTVTYTDTTPAICVPYSYTINAYNECYTTTAPPQVGSIGISDTIQLSGTIADTYTEGGLKVFKGYASEFVQLDWSVANNASSITTQHIYRRLLGDSTAPQLFTNVSGGTRQYKDMSADANTLYEYFIEAEGNCGIVPLISNRISDVGFRSPAGMVIGHVEYEGGISVQDCRINAEKSSGLNNNKSIYFDGDRDYFMFLDGDNSITANTTAKSISDYTTQADLDFMFDTAKGRTIEFWFNASEFKKSFMFTLGKTSDVNGNCLYIANPTNGNTQWEMVIQQNGIPTGYNFSLDVHPGEWHHFALTDKAGLIKIYIDGSNKDLYGNPMQWQVNTNWTKTISNPFKHVLFVGTDKWVGNLTNTFKGYIDEFRCWGVARTEEQISSTMNGYLQGNETDLGIYLRMDEGVGNFLYDASYKLGGIYNGNHAIMPRKLHVFNQLSFSTFAPPTSLLGSNAMTDANGNYIIPFVRYDNSGDLFKVTPYIANHQFQPNNRTLFIGNSTPVQNNVDFKDISSFPVTGTIFYGNSETELYCPASGIYLTVDGNVVIKDGVPAQTDANGEFNIRVPIGNHFVGTLAAQHSFISGRFPAVGTHDFQQPVSGLIFVDNTKQKVIGKVVGGTEQEALPTGLGRGINNIGTAKLVFESTKGCYTDTAVTNEFGEYSIDVFPLEYTLKGGTTFPNPEVFIQSNPIITFPVQSLNLSQVSPLQAEKDSVYDNNNHYLRIDSVQYNVIKNFIYRTGHSLFVLDTAGNPFSAGEKMLFLEGGDTILTNQLAYPVFQKGSTYSVRAKLTEIYINKDDQNNFMYDTTSASDGSITVNNQIAGGDPYTFNSGDTLLTFQAGDPNITNDFTKRFEISSSIGQTQNTWFLDAYVLGSKAAGTKFSTQSPQIVDHVLRDPPGSNSSAKIAKEQEFISSQEWSLEGGAKQNLETKIGMNFSTFVGLGVLIKNEVAGLVTAKTEFEFKVGGGETFEEKVSFSEDIQTSENIDFVGADADLFIGKSMNMDFGVADHVTIMDTSFCGGSSPCNSTVVTSAKGKKYSIGRNKGFQLDPQGYNTYFIYTQRHIKNQLIPDLIQLRNHILETNSNYTRVFTNKNDTTGRYGSNNDDPIWGTGVSSPTPLAREGVDSAGLSYIFTKTFTPTEIQVDSVRWYNEQIRLWREALSKNEADKLNAINGVNVNNPGTHIFVDSSAAQYGGALLEQQVSSLEKNISFSSGQSYTRSLKLSNQKENKVTWEVNVSGSIGAEIKAQVPAFEANNSFSYTIGLSTKGESKIAKSTSVEYTFTLKDDDLGDFYSVDILDGGRQNGPIFKTRGAETACPYEGALVTKYYKPLGKIIQPATVARERPGISIFPAKQVGIPSDQIAVFTLTLTNENTDDDMIYELSIDDATNANGAIIQIDGASANRDFYCYAGQSMTKTLTVRKSPYATDFNDIVMYFTSKCAVPFAQLQVSQTKFSVSFVPTCSQVSLQSPTNNWTLNSGFNNIMPIIMKDYDLNFTGFQKAIFRYKSSASSTWINAKEFYNLESAGGDSAILSRNNVYTLFDWDVTNLPDGSYDIQIQTVCNGVTRNSDIYSGKIDRLKPINFGQPTPLNGVLTANDELGIRFNETISQSLINKNLDIDVRGVLNATEIRHNTSLQLNGPNSKMIIPVVSLDNKSFSIEFNAKKTTAAAEVIASQENLWIAGFDATNNFYFEIGSDRVTASVASDTNWHHYAITYDHTSRIATLFLDGLSNTNSVFTSTIDEGTKDIVIGGGFTGAVHEVRLWSSVRTNSEIQTNYTLTANASTANLLGYWALDEGRGTIATDATGKRSASVPNSWKYAQEARSLKLNQTGYIEVDAAALNADENTNFTLSFWFNAESAYYDSTTLFSNGNVDTGNVAYSKDAWRVFANAQGKLFVKNKNYILPVNNPTLALNEWHHFALVVNRQGNTEVFINGEKTASTNSSRFGGFGGARAFFGIYGRQTSSDSTFFVIRKFFGAFDEISFWNTAREQKQIARDAYYRLKGDEPGLLLYYPFEKYDNIGFGQMGLVETLDDLADKTVTSLPIFVATLKGNSGSTPTFNNQTAPVKIERPVEAVTFNYVVNNDAIIITPTMPQDRIEKTILDITVRSIQDMNGNKMSSAVTWTAFVSKNQVVWNNNLHEATILKGATYSFVATIENKGGKQENYSITNLPAWLTASKTSGVINPQSTQQITFTVKEGLNIGKYEQNIGLTNQFGSGEILALTLTVTGAAPAWSVNTQNFENSMGFIGQLRINGILSTDENDMIAAFVGNEVRGVSKVNKTNYYVYLNVYSNMESNEKLSFRMYDASTGLILDDVLPNNILFSNNALIGTQANPTVFIGGAVQLTNIDLKTGWNWVSFNVQPTHPDADSVLIKMNASSGDIIKGRSSFDEYTAPAGWVGSLSTGGGINFRESYRLKVANAGILQVKGATINLKNTPVIVQTGWNWIAYLGSNILQVNEALASFNAKAGDVVKGQKSFAVYDPTTGWTGSLLTFEPGRGYMLNATDTGRIIYPKSPSFASYGKKGTAQTLDLPMIHETNMSVIAELVTDDYSLVHDYYLIAKDDKGNMLGGVSSQESLYYLTVQCNAEAGKAHFFLKHNTTGAEFALKETLAFTPNQITGYPQSFKLHLDENTTTGIAAQASQPLQHIAVYPNPMGDENELSIRYTSNEVSTVNIEVYSVLGTQVGKVFTGALVQGENHFSFNTNKLAKGIYLIVINKSGVTEAIKFTK